MQAARGASLITSETSADDTHDDSPAPPAAVGEPRRRRAVLALSIALVAWAVDVATKQLAVRELTDRDPVEVVGEWFQLVLVRNPGAAFSTGAAFTEVISVVAIVASIAITSYALRVRHRGWAVALGLLLSGVVGNLTDRLLREPGPLRGHVVDFFALPNWPVFNVADICINIGAVLMVVLLLKGIQVDGTRVDG